MKDLISPFSDVPFDVYMLSRSAFELWCWRRLLRVPWTARRSNQSILKEISPGISSEGMMLKLMWKVDSLGKTLMLGGIGGRRRRGRQRMRWLDGITDLMDVSLSELRSWWWTGRPGMLRFMGSQRVGHDWATELNWTELKSPYVSKPEVFLSLLFSHSVVSDSLWSHGRQHARLPCPSLSPRVYANSCPWSWWYHPTILSSVTPFSSCPQSFPASGSFPVRWLFASGGQSIVASASASVLL